MLLRLLLLFSCFFQVLYAPAQTFRGKLVYRHQSTLIDEETIHKLEVTGLQYPVERVQESRNEVLIRDGTLTRVVTTPEGALRYKELIDSSQAILVFPSGQTVDMRRSSFGRMALTLVRATEETRTIAGYPCRRYDYQTNDGKTEVTAWITTELPFDPVVQSNELPFFDNYFFPEGIVLEKTARHPVVRNHWKVESVELYEVPEEKIYAFFEGGN